MTETLGIQSPDDGVFFVLSVSFIFKKTRPIHTATIGYKKCENSFIVPGRISLY